MAARVDQEILDLIQRYNRDDFISNQRLRDWLEARRSELVAEWARRCRARSQSKGTPRRSSQQQAEVDALVRLLEAGIPEEREERTEEQQATLAAGTAPRLASARGEGDWWRFFTVQQMTDEELMDDREAIAECRVSRVSSARRSGSLDPSVQLPAAGERRPGGDRGARPGDRQARGKVQAIDQVEWAVRPQAGQYGGDRTAIALIFPFTYIPNTAQQAALMERRRLGRRPRHRRATGPYRAARDLLLRRAPRVGQNAGRGASAGEHETGRAAATRLGLALDDTVARPSRAHPAPARRGPARA